MGDNQVVDFLGNPISVGYTVLYVGHNSSGYLASFGVGIVETVRESNHRMVIDIFQDHERSDSKCSGRAQTRLPKNVIVLDK